MSFFQLLQTTLDDTLGPSLTAFRPELAIVATILALLLVRMLDSQQRIRPVYVVVVGTLVALWLAAPWQLLSDRASQPVPSVPIFTGMLLYDAFAIYMRGLLIGFVLLYAIFTRVSGLPDREAGTEFYVLILGALLGMCLMVSANHMMIVFLGVEMASVPSYALAGLLRDRRTSSEAALKFAVFGAGAAGVMLYGISLLTGVLGSAHLPTMAQQLASLLQSNAAGDHMWVLLLGGLMVAVGLAFKLSAVPFHFWAPDVFEGASAEVAAFLSIASKAAALGLLVRLAIGLGVGPEPAALAALLPVRHFIYGLVTLLAAVTCTFGNLAAYGQTNMKRLLAYSTIAHAGYMMMPVAAAMALAGSNPAGAQDAIASLMFYATIYLFMNLGAFAVVAFLRNTLGSEEIADYSGLIRTAPGLTLCMGIILFSLVGLPPLAGFSAKFTIFAALFNGGLYLLLVVGAVNTVLSLFYYLRVIRVMAMPPESQRTSKVGFALASAPGLYCLAMTVPLVFFGLWWNPLIDWAKLGALSLVLLR